MMKKTGGSYYFWAGIMMFFLLVTAMLVMGADNRLVNQVGRYRMSVTNRGNFTDIYVIDTVTGVIKYVGKNEGKPFDQISGK